jgi:hypothetical protein
MSKILQFIKERSPIKDATIKIIEQQMIYPYENCPTPMMTNHKIFIFIDRSYVIDGLRSLFDPIITETNDVFGDEYTKVVPYYYDNIDDLNRDYDAKIKLYDEQSEPRWTLTDKSCIIL